MNNAKVGVVQGVEELMAILADARMRPKAEVGQAVAKEVPVVVASRAAKGKATGKVNPLIAKRDAAKKAEDEFAVAPRVKEANVFTYEHGAVIEINGKSTVSGPKKKGKAGARGPKDDRGRDSIKDIFVPLLMGHAVLGKDAFHHSSEGLVIRMEEADYAIKVSRSKVFKIDATEEGFVAERDFSTRGKAKNSAAAIAKLLYTEFESEIGNANFKFVVVSAKASGIMLQGPQGEYTVKISKKRARVGFEAEKGAAYEK